MVKLIVLAAGLGYIHTDRPPVRFDGEVKTTVGIVTTKDGRQLKGGVQDDIDRSSKKE